MANLDRAALDKARSLHNLPPLTDAEFLALPGSDDLSEEEKLAKAEAERKQVEADAEKERLAAIERGKTQPVELSDEELLDRLSKKTGRTFSSFTELIPTDIVDAEKAAEERENEKFAWGLKNGKIKQKDVAAFISASKDPKSLVYELRLQQARKEDKNLDEVEFLAEFNDEFGIDAATTSRRYKNGQDTLSRLAEAILQKNYSSVYNLENEYAGHEKTQTSHKERQAKVKSAAPAYKATVDKVFSNLKKIKAQFSEDESFEVEGFDDSLNAIKESMITPEWAEKQILEGYTEETIQEIAYTTLLRQNFPFLVKQIAVQYLKKHAAGTKGVLRVNNSVNEGDDSVLTEAQQKLKAIIKENSPVPAQAN